MGRVTVAAVKRGEYVRLTPSGPVWIRGEYDRGLKRYSLQAFDDVGRVITRKGDCLVWAGFEF